MAAVTETVVIPPFVPKTPAASSHSAGTRSHAEAEKQFQTELGEENDHFHSIAATIPPSSELTALHIAPIEFDVEDDANHQIDFAIGTDDPDTPDEELDMPSLTVRIAPLKHSTS